MSRGWVLDDWREAFLVEARLRRLPGTEIGEALAEIDTYCADSGVDPTEAFGEPAEYATALAHGRRSGRGSPAGRRQLWRGVLVASGTLTGVMSLLAGVDAATRDVRATVTVGQLVSVAVGVAGIVGVAAFLLRPGRRRFGGFDWRFGLVAGVGIAVTTVPQLVWPQEVLRASAWPLLGVGLVVLLFAWWPLLSGRLLADRVVDPVTGAESVRTRGWLLGAVRWGLPVALLCAVLVAVLFGTTGPG
ncbi:hypothetical protein I0C86_25660 [Plantactinospora sp. S1510]|uniref:DUF1707 domain-containing protein n=1 Tax=Plantactinospora alkalitolerans TaxID=2789879 RepID=A0ABS0H253_9ACTN|nr:hypothetical protein [Plantactinospora alkalitolerans]MBF9132308.1 hypothetical protein [Plantactinospora alkalitolerans]